MVPQQNKLPGSHSRINYQVAQQNKLPGSHSREYFARIPLQANNLIAGYTSRLPQKVKHLNLAKLLWTHCRLTNRDPEQAKLLGLHFLKLCWLNCSSVWLKDVRMYLVSAIFACRGSIPSPHHTAIGQSPSSCRTCLWWQIGQQKLAGSSYLAIGFL